MILTWEKWYWPEKSDTPEKSDIDLRKMILTWEKWYWLEKNDIDLRKEISTWEKWYWPEKNDVEKHSYPIMRKIFLGMA